MIIPENKIEKAALENSKLHYTIAFSEELHKDADMDFRAGVMFAEEYFKEFFEWYQTSDVLNRKLKYGLPQMCQNFDLNKLNEELFELFLKERNE